MPKASRRLLVVDDEPEMRELLTILAQDMFPGLAIVHASSGDMALEKVAEGVPIDAVLADYRMPIMDGLELLTRLATSLPKARRVLMSSFDDPVLERKAIGTGAAHAVLRKTGDPEDLEGQLRTSLQGITGR